MKPGDLLQEGVVIRHDDQGVYVGRLAKGEEPCPAGHTEHDVGGRRAFLANGQCAIPPAFLHPKRKDK
jgi:hypothetical protein